MKEQCLDGFEDVCVADLMIPGSRTWDRQLIEEIFLEDNVVRILKTPISPTGYHDRKV